LVVWKEGEIWADLMPPPHPDPVKCRAWLILENRNLSDAFSRIEIPKADVILAETDSTLGAIPIETDWAGYLAPGMKDTVYLYKNRIRGTESSFGPPCFKEVQMGFTIRNADGDSTVFESDTLVFNCWI
jgi:hypothetical protein